MPYQRGQRTEDRGQSSSLRTRKPLTCTWNPHEMRLGNSCRLPATANWMSWNRNVQLCRHCRGCDDATRQECPDERRVAVGCLCCWFSVWHYQMPLVRLLLLPDCLPRLGISGCHFWGSVATATLEQLWADEQSVIDTAAAPSRSSRRWTLECGAAQVWRRVMFVCRRPGVRFYSYLDWPTRFLTHCCWSCCCCSGCMLRVRAKMT